MSCSENLPIFLGKTPGSEKIHTIKYNKLPKANKDPYMYKKI